MVKMDFRHWFFNVIKLLFLGYILYKINWQLKIKTVKEVGHAISKYCVLQGFFTGIAILSGFFRRRLHYKEGSTKERKNSFVCNFLTEHRSEPRNKLDLNGLTRAEAIIAVEKFLLELWNDNEQEPFEIVTGHEVQSATGIPILQPCIARMLSCDQRVKKTWSRNMGVSIIAVFRGMPNVLFLWKGPISYKCCKNKHVSSTIGMLPLY